MHQATNLYLEERVMSRICIFIFGIIIGTIIGLLIYRNGIGSNNGSEFWGDLYADMLEKSGRGIGNNSGSKFYSDVYIKEKFRCNRLT